MKNRLDRRFRLLLIAFAILLGFAQAYAARHAMISDGISYLDLGDAFRRGDWRSAVNGYWSPLYPCLLGLAMLLLRPAPQAEFPVVHVVNFLIYLAALGTFAFFWSGLRRRLPEWIWLSLGYLLFTYTALNMISLVIVTPDLLVVTAVYALAGVVLRLQVREPGWLAFAGLGLMAGLGYLAKAPLFMVGVATLAAAAAGAGKRRAPGLFLVGLAGFLMIAGPFAALLSKAKGRVTFGDSSRLNYAWSVNRVKPFIHWQGGPPGSGTPVHPTRQILDSPPVYEFGSPIWGTYPPWTDPGYWYEGVRPHFEWAGQLHTFRQSASTYYHIFLNLDVLLMACVVLLAAGGRGGFRRIVGNWPVLAVSLVGLGLFAPAAVHGRYVAPFVVVLFALLLSALELPEEPQARRLAVVALAAVIGILLVRLCGSAAGNLYTTASELVARRPHAPSSDWLVADGLHRLGIQPGDPVGVIAHPFVAGPYEHYWARLAGVRIVAELPSSEAEDFLPSDLATKERVIQAFERAGARAIVARRLAAYGSTPGWVRIEGTEYYARLLPKGSS